MVKYISLCSLQLLWGNSDSDCKRPLHHFQQGLDFLLNFQRINIFETKIPLHIAGPEKKKPTNSLLKLFKRSFSKEYLPCYMAMLVYKNISKIMQSFPIPARDIKST